jgi:GNAT superfamily N-acetyltransferase
MNYHLRDFAPDDSFAVNSAALASWEQYRQVFSNWEQLAEFISRTAELAVNAEIIVAEDDTQQLIGFVCYVAPGYEREDIFPADWAIIRMLSVVPAAQGQGVGRRLSEECIARARRDGAMIIGLHTSPVMKVALPLYLRMGFKLNRKIPDRGGHPYALYELQL